MIINYITGDRLTCVRCQCSQDLRRLLLDGIDSLIQGISCIAIDPTGMRLAVGHDSGVSIFSNDLRRSFSSLFSHPYIPIFVLQSPGYWRRILAHLIAFRKIQVR